MRKKPHEAPPLVSRDAHAETDLAAMPAGLFGAVFESAPNGIAIVDRDGRIVLVNREIERLFGYAREELVDQPVETLIPECYRSNHPAHRSAFAAAPAARPMGAGRDLFGLRKDRTEFPVEIGLNPIETDQGIMVLSTIVDITERKRAEQEREHLLERAEEAREEAEAANRLKDEFLAMLSHELRTPLNTVLGWVKLLRSGRCDSSLGERGLEAIERGAEAQAQLVEDLLNVSRIITGKLQLEVEEVDLESVVEAALDSVRTAAASKQIRIYTSYDPQAAEVVADPARLQQVIWNLLSNAVKFTARGGRIEIETDRVDGSVRIAVRDTGIGIEPDFLPYVFERFRQADSSTTRRYGGLGLGLALARQLVELHGGTISAESEGEGKGAVFTVVFPAGGPHPPTGGSRRRPPIQTDEELEDGATALAGLRVLLVEDDPAAREITELTLELAGAEVRSCALAAEGLEVYEEWGPDVLVSDIAMPGKDGYWLIEQVRARAGERHVPSIALTALVRGEDRDRALAAGYDRHVAKPGNPRHLVSVVAALASSVDEG